MADSGNARHLWLVAALVFFLAGVLGIWSIGQKPPAPAAAEPHPTPSATAPAESRPTPRATPTPEPTPQSSVKQLGEDTWRVYLTNRDSWYDTGIPVISLTCVDTKPNERNDQTKYLLKLKGKTFFSRDKNDGTIYFYLQEASMFDGRPVDPDFRDTIRMKIDDESQSQAEVVIVRVRKDCVISDFNENDEAHHKLHLGAEQWFAAKKAKLARQ